MNERITFSGGDVKFDQPWTLPPIEIIDKSEQLEEQSHQQQRYIISNFSYSPGLGNLMFQYASLRAIAAKHNAKLIVPIAINTISRFQECCKYIGDTIIDNLFMHSSNNERHSEQNNSFELLIGYFQAFPYFHPHQEFLIRKQFQFLPDIDSRARKLLERAKEEKIRDELTEQRSSKMIENVKLNSQQIDALSHQATAAVTQSIDDLFLSPSVSSPVSLLSASSLSNTPPLIFVGVHVRHGMDVTMNNRNIKHGHTVANKQYFQNAMQYFREKYRNVLFIVASDNLPWAKANIFGTSRGEVFFLETNLREVDFATLVYCNHTIMSTGTFSWWIAYLNQGESIYYDGWPRPGSVLDKSVEKNDFFLKNWKPMS
ncbi:unnamed protein product [Anisakis simplex]|uniref:L-Fucosyltransferase n=1 Tax=Anisakis simplex TaxID=6269 RepID=A0A0M3JT64_ANISI|nr:unnamed protein product [Anisakis simplex]